MEGLIERTNAATGSVDTDGDGFQDFLDPDDDNDTVFSLFEGTDPNGDFDPSDAIDSDRDGTPDYLDTDDDGDGIDSIDESPDPDQDGVPADALDFDKDGVPDYLDTDDEDDGVPSSMSLLVLHLVLGFTLETAIEMTSQTIMTWMMMGMVFLQALRLQSLGRTTS